MASHLAKRHYELAVGERYVNLVAAPDHFRKELAAELIKPDVVVGKNKYFHLILLAGTPT